MNQVILLIIIFAALGAVVWLALHFKKGKSQVPTIQNQIDKLKVKTTTPGGVFVVSAKTPSTLMQTAIDLAFAEMREIAARLGFTNKIEPNNYTILVFPSVRDYNADGTYCPSFQVYFQPGDPYDGSVYDQLPNQPGGWTYAAEQVLSPDNCTFVIADCENAEYIRASTHNGLDHIYLFFNDRQRYEDTKSHANGGGHPILT